jgi:hypothetical protein
MATKQVATVPKTGFMDLPPELRNKIYKNFISSYTGWLEVTPSELNKGACRSVLDLVKTLSLDYYFPFLLANKTIMHEAIILCLRTCSLRLRKLDQLDTVRSIRRNPDFQPICANIRALNLDISRYGHGIDQTREHTPTALNEVQTLISLTGLNHRNYCPRQNPSRPRSFAALTRELQLCFPNTEHICIELDKLTAAMQFDIKNHLVRMTWPTLREVKLRRPDLERQFTSTIRHHGARHIDTRHQFGVWPPQAIPWQVEMECRFLDSLNENLEKAMLKKREQAVLKEQEEAELKKQEEAER